MGKALTRGTCAVLPLVVLNKLSLEHQREAFTRYHNIVSHVVLHGTPVLSQNCTELVQHPPPYINTLPLCTSCGYEVAFCFRLWNHWKPTLISFLPSSSIMTWIMMFILVILNDHMISKRYASHTHTLLDPSHPIALLAWLSASIKDLVPGLAAALAAENPKSEFAMLNSTCSTCSTCSFRQWKAYSIHFRHISSHIVTYRHMLINHIFCDQKQLRPPLLGEAWGCHHAV